MGRSFTRQELYDLVWANLRTVLAKQLAVSDVWIGRQCKSAHIPMPPAGHWAGGAAWQSNSTAATADTTSRPFKCYRCRPELPSVRWRRHEGLAEPILPPVFDEDIDAQVDAALSVIGKVTPARDLANPHSGLSRILGREAKRREKVASSRWSHDQPLFDDATHLRHLRLFNSLSYAFERASAKADVHDDQPAHRRQVAWVAAPGIPLFEICPTDFRWFRRTLFGPIITFQCLSRSLHSDRLSQVARLVHIRASRACGVIGQQLQRHHMQDR